MSLLPGSGSPPDSAPAHSPRFLAECLALWRLDALSPPTPVDQSALNFNYQAETQGGTYFLRIHKRSRPREQLETEQAVLRWADERGIPVVLPVPSANGESLRSNGGQFVSLFPWLNAATLQRQSLEPAGARLLGETLGMLQTKLRDLDIPLRKSNGELQWDTERSIDALSRVDDLIRYYPAPGEERLRIQEAIRFQMELLESQEPRPSSDFEYLVRQPCHSDFHERNVLVHDSRVLAVVDWERVSLTPPIFELMRALTFCWSLDEPLLSAFLAGYAPQTTIDASAVAESIEMWWQQMLHNSWVYTESFVRGDHRVDRFFAETDRNMRRFANAGYRESLAEQIASFAC
jgi:Ser/Thr protein kinase RdoA (MazF antagonist)